MDFKPQDILLTQLAKFLEFDRPDAPMFSASKNNIDSSKAEVITDKQLRTQLQKQLLERGFCHGLSILHALMDKEGKLAWWEACLKDLANWNGAESALNETINLPGQTAPTTRRALFHRVLNYVVIAQVPNEPDFKEFMVGNHETINQTTVFKKDYLPLGFNLDLQYEQRKFVIGQFESSVWENLITASLLDTSIVLAHTSSHAFRIGKIEEENTIRWFVYDPNYNHNTGEKPIYKTFHTKQQMIAELLKISKGSLGLNITPLRGELPKLTEPILQSENITSEVIEIIIKYAPEKLLTFTDFTKIINLIDTISPSNFAFLYVYLPKLEQALVDIIKTNERIKSSFFQFLFAHDINADQTYLENFSAFLSMNEVCLQANDEFKNQLINLFTRINFFLFIKQARTDNLLSMFSTILSPFTNKDNGNLMLYDLLTLMNKMDEKGVSVWQELRQKSPQLCQQIIHLCVNHIQTLDIRDVYTIALTLSLKGSGAFKELCRERHPWRTNEFGETNSWQILMLACQKRLKDPSIVREEDWNSYDMLFKLKVSRSGFSGFFSKSVVLPTPIDINDVSSPSSEPKKI